MAETPALNCEARGCCATAIEGLQLIGPLGTLRGLFCSEHSAQLLALVPAGAVFRRLLRPVRIPRGRRTVRRG